MRQTRKEAANLLAAKRYDEAEIVAEQASQLADEEAQEDLRVNKNFNTYKGSIYENVVAEMLVKQGYELYFYKNEKSTIEMDFMVRDSQSLVPIEVKANDQATISLNKMIKDDQYSNIHYGIKFANKNIGFNGHFYTFPFFFSFLFEKISKR